MESTTVNESVAEATVPSVVNYSEPDQLLEYFEPTSTFVKFGIPSIFAVIFVIGVMGNGTVIHTVVQNKSMRKPHTILIVSLALGDFLLVLVSVTFFSTIYVLKTWLFGSFMCKMCRFLRMLTLGVSVFTLTALSVDRYLAIVRPFDHRSPSSRRSWAVAIGIWILSTVLASVEVPTYEVKNYYNVTLACTNTGFADIGDWFPCFKLSLTFVIYFVIPIVIISILYTLIARTLLKSSRMPGADSTNKSQTQERKKLALLVICLVVLFIICWLPRYVFVIWYSCGPPNTLDDPDHPMMTLKTASIILSFLNSYVNPLVLCMLSGDFRRYFRQYLCCCYGNRRQNG